MQKKYVEEILVSYYLQQVTFSALALVWGKCKMVWGKCKTVLCFK